MLDGAWPWLLWGSAIFSVLALISTFVGLPLILTRIPADYLVAEPVPSPRGAAWALRNLVGWTLIVLGVLMLVLPGQGLLTLLAGLVLADLPGKRRWIRLLLGRGPIRRGVEMLRSRAGVEPLAYP